MAILFWILCGLDTLLVAASLFFMYDKSTTSTITPTLCVFVLVAVGAIGWGHWLSNSDHPVGAIVVAEIPVLIAIAVALFIYFGLKNMRLF